jgi:uncharacterized protein YybS (DUF2232 family)
MRLDIALALCGLAASAVLVLGQSRALAAIALVASGVEVARAFGLLRLAIAGVPLGLVLGLCLAVPGLLAWLRASAKAQVSAAAVVTLVGVLQVVAAIGVRL